METGIGIHLNADKNDRNGMARTEYIINQIGKIHKLGN